MMSVTEPEDVIKGFAAAFKEGRPLHLLNTYRGIPIVYDAKIIMINQGYLALNVHPYQATCMALENKTYIQSDFSQELYQAKSVALDVAKCQAILTEFSRAPLSLGKRMAIRVQPKEPIDAEIYDGEHRIPGKLADISATGVGVFTFATYIYGDLDIKKGQDVMVDFRLPTSERMIRCRGKVTSLVHQMGTFLHRMGFSINTNPIAEPLLREYVGQRQKELLDELRRVYDSMVMGRETRS
jgi:hypothetical protein